MDKAAFAYNSGRPGVRAPYRFLTGLEHAFVNCCKMKQKWLGSGPAATAPVPRTTWSAVVYLLLATPLSLFLYLETTPEAQSFFAGYSDGWRPHSPIFALLLVSLVGVLLLWRLPLRGSKQISLGWLAYSVGLALTFRPESAPWHLAAAYGLCLPAWVGCAAWSRQLWQAAEKPAGDPRAWLENILLLASAVFLSFSAGAVFLLAAFPQLRSAPGADMLLAARVGGLAGVSVLAFAPALMILRKLCGSQGPGALSMLLVIGALLEAAAMLILLNGLRFVGGIFVGLPSCCFVLGLTIPTVALFCRRAGIARASLAEAFLSFGRFNWMDRSLPKGAVVVVWLTMLGSVFWIGGCAHLYYEWGFATAALYSALSAFGTWLLLTMLPRRIQPVLSRLCLACAALGLLTFLPPLSSGLPWSTYLKFDKNFGSVVHAYYRHYPRSEPSFRQARQLLATSHSNGAIDLTQVQRQELVLKPKSPRPNVFFIVADALRGETYSPSADESRRYPGLDWMATRFTAYDNAWTSYNSTRGSYPAYLNGRMQPAWFEYFWSYPVRQDNILSRACDLAGYRCFNFATFSEDFSPCWPACSCVALRSGGIGLGDPGVVFPQALETLDAQRAKSPQQPVFFYLHLFNMHQPLFRRPGIPMHNHGLYFMRGLYEQNVAYFDAKLLAFLQGLQERGLLKDSMIVICADHGEELFDLGGVYHGWQINPWVMHVPLFIHYPNCVPAPPAQVLTRPVNLIDLAPTICQTMGVEIERKSNWQGLSLLEPEPAEPRSFLLLSWKNPLVGQMSFSPCRMLVLDLNSGEEQLFVPGRHGWLYNVGPIPPAVLADRLKEGLADLFGYWQMARL